MFEIILNWDKELLLFINGMHSPCFDSIMFFISKKTVWIPLYCFFLYLIIRYFGKKSWLIILCIGLLIFFSDQLSSGVMKNTFQRLRPCHDPSLSGMLHLVHDHCGGKYGFVSSHAANSFALAVFLGMLFRGKIRFMGIYLLIWAAMISYSRIYLGVHYPGDVVAGAILGAGTGLMIDKLYLWMEKKFQ